MAAPTPEEIEELWSVHTGPEATAERERRANAFDDTRSWIDPNGHKLSDRVWRQRAEIRSQIDEVLRQAIRTGEDALLTAKKLEQYLDPAYAPVRTENGRLKRNQSRSIITTAPGRGGSGSFPARRLARTEITRAHGQATVWTAERTPFAKGVKWNLSGRHPKADECDRNASQDSGLGRGVYKTSEVPRYPSHPQDLCNLSVATEDDTDAIVKSLREQYGLDEVTADAIPESNPIPTITAPTIKTETDLRAFFDSIGVNVIADTKSPAIWNTVAEAYADQVSRGRPVPPTLHFVAKQSKSSVAAYTRRLDARTGELIAEEMNIYQRNPFWKDAALARRQEESGWWSSGDPDGVVIHELGHYEHFQRIKTDSFNYSLEVNGVVRSKRFSPTERAIANRVSHYGASDAFEFVAETYTGIRKGKTYDDEVMALYRALGGPEV